MKKQTPLNIPADHPAFAGHFPTTPIVPGVVLLDAVLHVIATDSGLDTTAWEISSAKFLSPLKPFESPLESIVIEHEQLANGAIKFQVIKFETPDTNRQIVVGNLVKHRRSLNT